MLETLAGDGGALVILTTAGAGVMPGGASLDAPEFARLRALLARNRSDLVDLAAWNAPSAAEAVDLSLGERAIPAPAAHALLGALDALPPSPALPSPDPLRRLAPRLAGQALAGDVDGELLRGLVGAGPGTTPSGDDVIVGVLAGLQAAGRARAARTLARRALRLLPATTAASGHYLSAAADARFGEHVHELVAALSAGRPPARTIGLAARWGATSGIDLLFGLAAALSATAGGAAIGEAA